MVDDSSSGTRKAGRGTKEGGGGLRDSAAILELTKDVIALSADLGIRVVRVRNGDVEVEIHVAGKAAAGAEHVADNGRVAGMAEERERRRKAEMDRLMYAAGTGAAIKGR